MARIRINLKGVHRVRKRLSNGAVAEYHYAWRGGPKFWDMTAPFGKNSLEYVEAFKEATKCRRDHAGTFQEVIDAFVASSDFARLGPRTQRDHKRNIMHENGVEKKFGTAPINSFNDPRIRQVVLKWRDGFSEGTGDNMMDTLRRIVSFAYQRGYIGSHHLQKVQKRVKSNRADVIWLPEEVEAFVKGAPRYVGNILVVAVETGFRPGDLQLLERRQIEDISNSRKRLLVRTRKSNRRNFASVPVTRRFAELLDDLPGEQQRILVGEDGEPFEDSGSLGALITKWRKRLGIRSELRLYDARGTAVTRLVRAGCTLSELAAHMGWSLAHASQMLERYARLDPDMSDDILEKVERAERKRASLDQGAGS